MVLENRLIVSLILCCTLFFLFYVSIVNAQTTDRTNIKEITLELVTIDGKCVVIDVLTGTKFQTKLTAPCMFIRNSNNKILKFSYPQKGTILAISGAPAKQNYISKWSNISLHDKCSNEAQGLIVNGSKVNLTKNKNEAGLFCPHIGLDEKVYYGFAYQ